MSEQTDSLLEFPCEYGIKAMGKAEVEFDLLVLDIVRRHAKFPDRAVLKSRPSKNGTYLSVTVTIYATCKAELETIYQHLSAHPLVLTTL